MTERVIHLESDLLDLEGFGLGDMDRLDGTVLGRALNRVLEEADGTGATMSSWASSV